MLAALALASLPAAQRSLTGSQDTSVQKFFALPLPREASESAEVAREHLASGRWNQGLGELQRLLEDGRGDLLPPTWRPSDAEPSVFPTYPGAAGWARATLLALGPEGQERYRERFEDQAAEALASAVQAQDPQALVTVATRWPITRAAESAWWALGDLEMERGDAREARAAWTRAEELVHARGDEPGAGAKARLDLADAVDPPPPDGKGFREDPVAGGVDGSTPEVPRADADRWFVPLDLKPFADPSDGDGFAVEPLLSGDTVFVCSSLRMYAIDAFTGAIRWQSEPDPNWDQIPARDQGDYFSNIARDHVRIACAESQGVVVAPMQIPYTAFPDTAWQGIPIFSRIPERRLYAFDRETGAPLWNHSPAMHWSREARGFVLDPGDDFAHTALVAAPPTIAGSRVLVPCYRMQSRIEYHVACYDLESGTLLWDTQLISGQRERNMFGRAASEFAAAPLTVSGDRVIAQTELGAICGLDLLSGELLWSTEYEQIPIRRNQSYLPPPRITTWRATAPVVVDGLVLSTPTDSPSLVCLELADGAARWSHREYDLHRLDERDKDRYQYDVLLGADRDTVYLGGEKIGALQKSGGLRSRLSFGPRWTQVLERSGPSQEAPRPLLTDTAVVVPRDDERLVLDRRDGKRIEELSAPWTLQDQGSLALGDGVLYSLGRRGLLGLFDWRTLLSRQRARLAAAPDDPNVRASTAAMFLRRARSLREREGDATSARKFLQEARDLLAPRIAAAGGIDGLPAHDRSAAALLHSLLREDARALADLARGDEARKVLTDALALAPTPLDARDTLFELERLERMTDPDAHLALLDTIAQRAGDLPLPQSVLDESPLWLIGEALLTEGDLTGWADAKLTVGLWVLLARADQLARQRDGEDAIAALQEAADRYGTVKLNDRWDVAALVNARIARRIEIDGPAVYARFEREAQDLLARALQTGDDARIELVVQRYPFSDAARKAEEALLDRGFATSDLESVASLAHSIATREGVEPAKAVSALCRLGTLLASEGNRSYLAGLLQAQARRTPGLEVELPDGHGGKVADLAAEWRQPAAGPPPARFGPDVSLVAHVPGDHEPIGELVDRTDPENPVREMAFLVDQRQLAAYALDAPERLAWSINVPFGSDSTRCATAEGRVLVASRGQVIAYDTQGKRAWMRDVGSSLVLALDAADGVAIGLVGTNRQIDRAIAWDARTGAPLWEFSLADRIKGNSSQWGRPLVADGVAVFLHQLFSDNSTALVVDLFRGTLRASIDLGPYGKASSLDEAAWIQDGSLCVPRFQSRGPQGSYLAVYDLDTGAESWRLSFTEDENFHSVLRYGDRSYALVLSNSLRRGDEQGSLYEVDFGLQRLRPSTPIRLGELPVGLEPERVDRLDSPWVFFVPTEGNASAVPVRAVQIETGRSYSVHLPVAQEELYPEDMPRPVVSQNAMAIAYRVQDLDTLLVREARVAYVPMDANGAPDPGGARSSRTLAAAGSRYQTVQLLGYGDALFVLKGTADDTARLEVHEGKR